METQSLERTEQRRSGENPDDVAILYSWATLDEGKSRDFSANRREYRAQMRHRAAEQLRLMELKAQSEAEAAAVEAEAGAAAAHAEADAATAKLAASRTKQTSGMLRLAEKPEVLEAEEQVELMRRSSLREAAQQARRAAAERLEAARRAEAAALADSIARREEREIAEAQASALRQAAHYAESEARVHQNKAMPSGLRRSVIQPDEHFLEHHAPTDESLIARPWEDTNADVSRNFGSNRELKPIFEELTLPATREIHGQNEKDESPFRRERHSLAEPQNGNAGPLGRVIVTSTPYQEFRRSLNDSELFASNQNQGRVSAPLPGAAGRLATESLNGLEHSNSLSVWPVTTESMKSEPPRAAVTPPELRLPVDPVEHPGPAWLYPRAPIQQAEESRVETQMSAPIQVVEQSMERTIRRESRQVPFASAEIPMSFARSGAMQSTLRHASEQAASRWHALNGVSKELVHKEINSRQLAREKRLNTPFVMVYSLAGGVGKTSLVATLGRVLASLGEKILLTDTTSQGLLPFYFGAKELHPGIVRTFSPPSGGTDTPIDLISYDLSNSNRALERNESEVFEDLIANSQRANRVLMDLSLNCAWMVGRLAWARPTVLIPLAADMNSVISLRMVEQAFAGMHDADGKALQPVYMLNQFDGSLPLHLDVREVLRKQLGDRLLPFAVRRANSVSEALAEGMTVIDYDPESEVTKDYMGVADWLRTFSAPSTASLRYMRWVER